MTHFDIKEGGNFKRSKKGDEVIMLAGCCIELNLDDFSGDALIRFTIEVTERATIGGERI